ncbi:hypothetical protein [Pedobacter ureilyticus]|uniref:Uncharacterized protein n=1 Tax=Pedobacter ureilyticus TaxID=1393051 RepID=A0ABW9J3C8_9SPHI|nr:hypothetical protein [Pedobacter helvus]
MRINEADWIRILPDGSNLPADNDWLPYDSYNEELDFVFPRYKSGWFIRLMWLHKEATHFRSHI